MTALLTVEDLCRSFGGLKVTQHVSLRVGAGGVHCLIGPNGAGKTTLFNLISGFLRPDSGRVTFDGRDVTGWSVHRLQQAGLARSFQRPELFPSLTVREHLDVASAGRPEPSLSGPELFERFAFPWRPEMRVRDLSHGEQKKLDIALAVLARPKLLLLDEPTAGMSNRETDEMGVIIRSLTAQGVTLVVVEHDLGLVRGIADVVTVLERGSVLAEGRLEDVENDPRVREAFLGSIRWTEEFYGPSADVGR